jgi:hypothetical protein
MGLPFSVRHAALAIATSLRVPHLNKAIAVPKARENVNCVKLLFFHATRNARTRRCGARAPQLSPRRDTQSALLS